MGPGSDGSMLSHTFRAQWAPVILPTDGSHFACNWWHLNCHREPLSLCPTDGSLLSIFIRSIVFQHAPQSPSRAQRIYQPHAFPHTFSVSPFTIPCSFTLSYSLPPSVCFEPPCPSPTKPKYCTWANVNSRCFRIFKKAERRTTPYEPYWLHDDTFFAQFHCSMMWPTAVVLWFWYIVS